MSDKGASRWTVKNQRRIEKLVVDEAMAPLLRRERRIGFTQECPKGHKFPHEVTADETVVRAAQGLGFTIGCLECTRNYILDLGEWPVDFTG
jgi:hypothetical protein